MSEIFEMVAKTFQGLEGVLSDELTALGAQEVTQGTRMVAFKGDKEMMYRANFALRTALRILKPIYKFHSTDADDLYEQVKRYNWDDLMTENSTFSIDCTVFSDTFRHSRFVTYRVKDAIADYFMERCGKRPSIRLNSPDYQLNVHINGNDVTISLDSSGEPLYKRGWRVAQTDAPINEVLAAGIIKLSGWDGQSNLVDPMCGSGTFLIEAALIATNMAPGLYRKEYAFQHWPDYDADLFNEIYNYDSDKLEFNHKIYGYDILGKAVATSLANVKNAGLSQYIEVDRIPIEEQQEAPSKGVLITNPPYGERLTSDDLPRLYATLGEKLKKVYVGYDCWLICGSNKALIDSRGLKASLHYPLLNGDIPCELREYVIFDGSYDDLRRKGGTIKNEGFRASDKPTHARRERRDERHADDLPRIVARIPHAGVKKTVVKILPASVMRVTRTCMCIAPSDPMPTATPMARLVRADIAALSHSMAHAWARTRSVPSSRGAATAGSAATPPLAMAMRKTKINYPHLVNHAGHCLVYSIACSLVR